MRVYTTPGKWVATIFQVHPTLFQVFLRLGFGRRALPFAQGFLLPLFVIGTAIGLRMGLEQWVLYGPATLLPVFGDDPTLQALRHSEASGLERPDLLGFAILAGLFVALSLIHRIALLVRRWRKTDPTNTRYWGTPLLAVIPGLNRLPMRVVHLGLEPGFLVVLGFGLCAMAPVFGIYVMAGGLVMFIEQASVWRSKTMSELDARDSLARAESQAEAYDKAQAHADAASARAWAVPRGTLARVQKDPHALLALSEDETCAVRERLGPEAFDALVDELEPAEQHEIATRIRVPGFRAVPQPKSA